MVDLSERELRVLAWPGPSQSQSNPYTSLVYGEFEKAGLAITPYSIWTFHGSRADIFHIHWPEAILWGRLAAMFPSRRNWRHVVCSIRWMSFAETAAL